ALVPLVYDELRRVAHRYLRKERADHTLQSTALVHEAYLRLEKQGAGKFENRSVDMVTLDDALNELAKLDQQQSRIVELRFFGGLSVEETSDVLKLSP